ncbi:hypothetical protein G6F47_012989 [Rhizopus delemar]|nr:hypothetical protein G6F54_013684 [Rhizopus delemar]KAG1577816.1 hypothetical protein G6F47_012989 [Rhizopus delemar]
MKQILQLAVTTECRCDCGYGYDCDHDRGSGHGHGHGNDCGCGYTLKSLGCLLNFIIWVETLTAPHS